MSKYTYEKLAPEYTQLWNSMKIIRDSANLAKMADKVKLHQDVYKQVEKATGVPWQLVAVIHIREAGLSDVGKWKGVLHNGEKIVGTGLKTRIVPSNRGPFSTWHSAAVDALTLKGFNTISSWPVSRQLWALEPYNGYGYRNKGLRSPYLWASTNHQQKGKYVADHVFDPNVMDTQMGAAAMLKFLGVGQTTQGDKALKETSGTVISTATLAYIFQEHVVPIVILGGIVIGTIWLYRYFNSRNK